jgi:homocysteine S-methyltransferase
MDEELRRFAWKVEAGADFAITQPVFDPDGFHDFLDRTREFGIPILAGIWPLLSLRNAEFLANEVPEWVVERVREAEERGEGAAEREGVALAREILSSIKDSVQGVLLSAPGNRVDRALAVLSETD